MQLLPIGVCGGRRLLVRFVCLLALSQTSFSAEVFWINTAGGSWSETANWDTGTLPGPNDDVMIVSSGTYSIVMDISPTIRSLTFGSSTGSQTLCATSQTLTCSSPSSITTSAIMKLDRTIFNGSTTNLANAGVIELLGGQLNTDLDNSGEIMATNAGLTGSQINGSLHNHTAATLILGAEGASLCINHGAGDAARNFGEFCIATRSELRIKGGHLITTSCSFKGPGRLVLRDIIVSGGTVELCTSALLICEQNVSFHTSASFINRGHCGFRGSCRFFGPLLNATGGQIEVVHSSTFGNATLICNAPFTNCGVVVLTSNSVFPNGAARLEVHRSCFLNCGVIRCGQGGNTSFAHRSILVNNTRCPFENRGRIVNNRCFFQIETRDCPFQSGSGRFELGPNAFCGAFATRNLRTQPYSITCGTIISRHTTSGLSFAMNGEGELRFGRRSIGLAALPTANSQPATTATILVNGQMFLQGGRFMPAAAEFRGSGEYRLQRTELGEGFRPAKTSVISFFDSSVRTTATLFLPGTSHFEAKNVYDGPVEFATTATIFINSPRFGQSSTNNNVTIFNDDVLNNGTIATGRSVTTNIVFLGTDVTLLNNGIITNGHVTRSTNGQSTTSIVFLGSDISFTNNGTITTGQLRPTTTAAFTTATTAFLTTNTLWLAESSAAIINNGTFHVVKTGTTGSGIVLNCGSTLKNHGHMTWEESLARIRAASNMTFADGPGPFGGFKILKGSRVDNCGDWTLLTDRRKGGIELDSSTIVNLGRFRVRPNDSTNVFKPFVTTASLIFVNHSLFTNDSTGNFNHTRSAGGIAARGSRIQNFGDWSFTQRAPFVFNPLTTTATLFLGSDAFFENLGRVEVDSLGGGRLVTATSGSRVINSGAFNIISMRTTATFSFSSSSSFVNHGTFEFRNFATTATIFFSPLGSFVNNGSLLLDSTGMKTRGGSFVNNTGAGLRLLRSSRLQFLRSSFANFDPAPFLFGNNSFLCFDSTGLGGNPRLERKDSTKGGRIEFRNGHIYNGELSIGPGIEVDMRETELSTVAGISNDGDINLFGRNTFNGLIHVGSTGTIGGQCSVFAQRGIAAKEIDFRAAQVVNSGRMNFSACDSTFRVATSVPPQYFGSFFSNEGALNFRDLNTTATIDITELSEFSNDGAINITRAVLEVRLADDAIFRQESSASIDLDKGEFRLLADRFVNPTTATLRGDGKLALGDRTRNNGAIFPGRSPGSLTIDNDLEQSSTASLGIEIGGTRAGLDYDELIVNGALTLDGSLDIQLIDDFIPEDGDEFTILRYSSVTGAFAEVTGTAPGNGISFSLELMATHAVLRAAAVSSSTVDLEVYLQGYWDGMRHRRTPAMLELRSGATLISSILTARGTALVSSSGSLSVSFDNVPDGSYWLVLRHGGHLPVGSVSTHTITQGATTIVDFSDPDNVVNPATALPSVTLGGVEFRVVRAGDFNANQDIGADDFLQYFLPNFGLSNPGRVPVE